MRRRCCWRHERRHALGGRFHRGRLGHDQPARLSARRRGRMRRRVRGRQGHPVGPDGRLSRGRRRNSRAARRPCRCCSPGWSARTAAGSRRLMFRARPALDDSSSELVWAGEREAIVPGVSLRSARPRRRHARRGSAAARRRRRRHGRRPRRWSAIRARTTNGRRCATARSTVFRTVMTGELFNLLKEHSILADLLQRRGRARTTRSGAASATRIDREMLPADLFAVRAARAARPGEQGGRRLLCQRPADRRRRAHRA